MPILLNNNLSTFFFEAEEKLIFNFLLLFFFSVWVFLHFLNYTIISTLNENTLLRRLFFFCKKKTKRIQLVNNKKNVKKMLVDECIECVFAVPLLHILYFGCFFHPSSAISVVRATFVFLYHCSIELVLSATTKHPGQKKIFVRPMWDEFIFGSHKSYTSPFGWYFYLNNRAHRKNENQAWLDLKPHQFLSPISESNFAGICSHHNPCVRATSVFIFGNNKNRIANLEMSQL